MVSSTVPPRAPPFGLARPSGPKMITHVSNDHISNSLWSTSVTVLDSSDRSFEICQERLVDEDDSVDVSEEGCSVVGRDDGHGRISREESERVGVGLRE